MLFHECVDAAGRSCSQDMLLVGLAWNWSRFAHSEPIKGHSGASH